MYAQPLEVWDEVGQTKNNAESFGNVKTGKELDLKEKFLIQNSFTVSGSDQDIVVQNSSNNIVSDSDYDVGLRDGKVTWNGTDNEDIKIRYKAAPIPNEVCVNKIESATEQIDRETNTTFNGLETVTETYDITSKNMKELVLFNRPVRSVDSVRVNEAKTGSTDDFNNLDIGRDKDVFRRNDLCIEFTSPSVIYPGSANLEVTYSYGYNDIPREINRAARKLAAKKLMEDTVLGEIMDGRDDYGTQLPDGFNNDLDKLISEWTIQRMGEQVPVDI